MATNTQLRIGAVAAIVLAAALAAQVHPAAARPATGATVRELTIAYRAFDGRTSHATLLLPSGYGPGHNPVLPLVISPHGRGLAVTPRSCAQIRPSRRCSSASISCRRATSDA